MTRERCWIGAGALLLAASSPLAAQGGLGGSPLFVNSEAEAYLRNLQVAGLAPAYPWSVRAFSPGELDRLLPPDSVPHPWAGRRGVARASARGVSWAGVDARLTYNSAHPFGANDGAVWAGRGLTTAVQAGAAGRWGPLSATLAPVAFWAQNADFDIMPTGREGRLRYADARSLRMDYPQRFGSDPYARVDPGQSTLRLDFPLVTLGVSTANQHWGPAAEYPLLLGNNAGGFPHAFVGTGSPVPLGIGTAHARVVWGELSQSDYSPVTGQKSRRYAGGMVVLFSPRGVPGLELGVESFVQMGWPEGGLSADDLTFPLFGVGRTGRDRMSDSTGRENQIAGVFGRWVFPRGGLEVYGAFAREDQVYDLRNFFLEPDHDAAYTLGFRKVWARSPASLVALRGEVMSTQRPHLDLIDRRTLFYTHATVRQGHTERGQILGASAGHGGSGTVLAADYYHPGGRWTVSLQRELRRDRADYALAPTASGGPDAVTALGLETVRFTRRGMELTAGLRAVRELNRDFGDDAFNLNAVLGLRASF